MTTLPRSKRWTRRECGFTLVELLTVIAIIMVLIGLLMPATAMMRRSAQRKATATRAQSISQAIKNYRQVYGKFPGQTQDDVDQFAEPEEILSALTNNPRKILFLEISPRELGDDGALVDAWGMRYVIAMDENDDGTTELTDDGTATYSTNVIGHPVCVMSWGGRPEEEDEGVYSWIK